MEDPTRYPPPPQPHHLPDRFSQHTQLPREIIVSTAVEPGLEAVITIHRSPQRPLADININEPQKDILLIDGDDSARRNGSLQPAAASGDTSVNIDGNLLFHDNGSGSVDKASKYSLAGEAATNERQIGERRTPRRDANGGAAVTLPSGIIGSEISVAQMDRNDRTKSGSVQERESTELVNYTARLCGCGKPALVRVAGPRSENRGLRYLSCEAFVFFASKKKRNYCNFFEWIDPPRVTREEVRQLKKEARAKKRQKLEVRAQSCEQQTAIKTRAAVRHEVEQGGQDLQKASDVMGAGSRSTCFLTSETSVQSGRGQDTMMRISNDYSESPEAEIHGGKKNKLEAGNALNEDGTGATGGHSYSKAVPLLLEGCEATPLDQGCDVLMERNANGAQRESEKCIYLIGDKTSTELGMNCDASEHGQAHVALNEGPLCFCSQPAVMKTAKSKGPNKGLRYWICQNASPLFAKRRHDGLSGCKFFMWVDPPRATREQIREAKKEARAKKRQKLGVSAEISEQQASISPRQHASIATRSIVKCESEHLAQDLQTTTEDTGSGSRTMDLVTCNESSIKTGGVVDTTTEGAIIATHNDNNGLLKAELQEKKEEILQIGIALDEDRTGTSGVSAYSKIWNALPPVVVEGCEVMWQIIESSSLYQDCGVIIKGTTQELQRDSEVCSTLGGDKIAQNLVEITTQESINKPS